MTKKFILTWVLLLVVTHVMGYTITVSPIEIEVGKSTNLIINLSNTETNLTAYQMSLYLPDGVTVQKKANGKYAFTHNANRHDGEFTVSVKDAADGSILITCFSTEKDVLTGNSGELIRLPIEVATSVTTSLQGSIKDIEFTDVNAQAYKTAIVFFTMTIVDKPKPKLTLTASPAGGQVAEGTVVTLTAEADGNIIKDCEIYYTLNGSMPSKSSTKYTSSGIAIKYDAINNDCTLKAIAIKDGYEDSEVLTETYTMKKEQGVYPTSIHFSVDYLVIRLGDSYLIEYSYGYPPGTTLSQKISPPVIWSSSNTNVVTVTNGTINAIAKGTSVITTNSSNGLSANCEVTVIEHKISDANIKQVSAGGEHTMFLKEDGSLWACGHNSNGQLGDSSTTDCSTPKQVMTGVAAVSAGGYHTMILKNDGSLWACGYNNRGQLGDGTTNTCSTPKQVMTDVAAVSAGNYHTMILKTDGSLWACGDNFHGQLGDGTTTDHSTPKQVMACVAAVSAGNYHTMILKTDGSLWACGYNNAGQLGDGTTTDHSTPKQVMTGVSAAAAGLQHTMILKNDGSLWACGYNNYGELGDGTITKCSTPKQVMIGVSTVAAGGFDTMIIKNDGSLWACGDNMHGQLGDSSTTDFSTPKQVMADVATVSAGGDHTMILKNDGSLWACGYNWCGQLGDGTTVDRYTPVKISVPHAMGYTITVPPIEIEAGKSTNLIINLSNTETNLTAYQMSLYLPNGVTVQKDTNGKYAFTPNANRHDGEFTLSVKDAADGSILITCFSTEKDVLVGNSGELIRLPIEIASSVTTSLQGSIKNIEFTDVNAQAYKTANVDFTMTIVDKPKPKLTLTASPASGLVAKGTVVTFTAKANGDIISHPTILYTLDGKDPQMYGYMTYYENEITINENCTLKAIALKDGYEDSEVLTETYSIKPTSKLLLSASPAGGQVSAGTIVTLTAKADNNTVSDCDIYYTLDDRTPSKSSSKYTSSGIAINNDCTLKAIAYKDDYESSDVLMETYIIQPNNPTSGDGTLTSPYSVADVFFLFKNRYLAILDKVYVKGIVSQVVYEFNEQYGTASFYMSDDGTTNNPLYAKQTLYLGNKKFVQGNTPIKKGDKVIIYGDVYEDLDEDEQTEITNGYLYSLNGKTEDNGTYTSHIILSSAGYATFHSSESAYMLPNGLSAQVVTNVSNDKLTYKTIADGSMFGVIPKGTAVMLVSAKKQAGTFTLTSSESTATYNGSNLLRGSDKATTTTGNGSHYKLSYGPSGTQWSDVFGWYWGAQGGAPFQIEGHKAWLVVPNTNRSRAAGFTIDGDATELEIIEQDASAMNHYYDLQGRRVNQQPSRKGVYIKNGQKMIVK